MTRLIRLGPIRCGSTNISQLRNHSTTSRPFQNSSAESAGGNVIEHRAQTKCCCGCHPAPISFRCARNWSFQTPIATPLSSTILQKSNIELSCAADSPARSEPKRRHLYEPEDRLRRQLQRFVMSFPLGFRSPSRFTLALLVRSLGTAYHDRDILSQFQAAAAFPYSYCGPPCRL